MYTFHGVTSKCLRLMSDKSRWMNPGRVQVRKVPAIARFLMLTAVVAACIWLIPQGARAAGGPAGVALIVGNDNYPLSPLHHSVNDAQQIAQAMRQLGFTVRYSHDLDLKTMQSVIKDFRDSITGRDVTAFFYYSGHAWQVNGVNYLVPISFDPASSATIPAQTISLDLVFQAMATKTGQPNFVVLDACRSNPFAINSAPTAWIPGLASPTNVPSNTLVAFSTSPGKTAEDGEAIHSPYSRALLRYIRTPGLPVEDLFKDVRSNVESNTDNLQVPWENTSLSSVFYFRDPIVLMAQIHAADDDALLLVNGEQVIDWNNDGATVKSIPINAGTNVIEAKVYNQRSYTGGIQGLGGHLPEGWNYSATLSRANGSLLVQLSGAEDRPADNGPHHGKLFTTARVVVSVDDITGDVSIVSFDNDVWKH